MVIFIRGGERGFEMKILEGNFRKLFSGSPRGIVYSEIYVV